MQPQKNASVAVIMSVYKSDNLDYLKDAVESIRNQTYRNLDFFIYRDGPVSTELDCYLTEISSNDFVKYSYSDRNNGLAYALNSLIDTILNIESYSYIVRMDSDDISRLERIEKQVLYMEKNKHINVSGTYCNEFGASFALDKKCLPTSHDKLLDFSISRCPFIHPSVIFRVDVFKAGYRYPENTKLTEDMALWFELLNAGFIFGNLDEVLLDYRLNEHTINRRQGLEKALSEFQIRFDYMFKLKKISVKNTCLILSRLFFHLLPSIIIKKAYLYLR